MASEAKNSGCHGKKTEKKLISLKIFLVETIRLRATKFGMCLYLMGHVALSSGPLPSVPWGQIWPRSGGYKFYLGLYRENFRNLPVPSHKAYAYQILHVSLSSGPLPRVPKL